LWSITTLIISTTITTLIVSSTITTLIVSTVILCYKILLRSHHHRTWFFKWAKLLLINKN
jgi:hypothetical protein